MAKKKPDEPLYKPQQHTIKKFNLKLNIQADVKMAELVQKKILDLWKGHLGDRLDRLFSRLVPANVHIVIDRLDIKLDRISFSRLEQLDSLLEEAVLQEIERVLRKKLASPITKKRSQKLQAQEAEDKKERFARPSRYQLLRSLLADGRYPSWAAANNDDVQTIFRELLQKEPKNIARLLYSLRKNNQLAKRLAYQFTQKDLEGLLPLILPKNHKKILKQWRLLRQRLLKGYQQRYGTRLVSQEVNAAVMQYLLDLGKGQAYAEKEMVRQVLEQTQTKLAAVKTELVQASPNDESYISTSFSKEYRNLDVLRYFLQNGSIPVWAKVESQRNLQQLIEGLLDQQLVQVQRMVEQEVDNPYFLQRLIYQFTPEQLFQLLEPISERNKQLMQAIEQNLDYLFVQRRSEVEQRLSSSQLRQSLWEAWLGYAFQRKRQRLQPNLLMEQALQSLAPKLSQPYENLLQELHKDVRRRKNTTTDTLRTVVEELSQGQERIEDEQEQAWERYEQLIKQYQTANVLERQSLRKSLRQVEQQLQLSLTDQLPLRRQKLLQQASSLGQELDRAEQAFYFARSPEEQSQLQANFERLQAEQERQRQAMQRLRKLFQKDLSKTLLAPPSPQRSQRLNQWQREAEIILSQVQSDLREWQLRQQAIQMALDQSEIPLEQKQKLRRSLRDAQRQIQQLQADQDNLTQQSKQLEKVLKAQESQPEEESQESEKNVRLDFLVFFLQYGSIPWWAEDYRNTSLETLFVDFLQNYPEQLRTALLRTGKNPVVWRRLVNQVAAATLEYLVKALFPRQANVALVMAHALENLHLSGVLPQLRGYEVKEFKWGVILEQLLYGQSSSNWAAFAKETILALERNYDLNPLTALEYISRLMQSLLPPEASEEEWLAPLEQLRSDAEIQAATTPESQAANAAKLSQKLESQEQIMLLVDFLQSQGITPDAEKLGFNSVAQYEELLVQLIDEQKPLFAEILAGILSNATTRDTIVGFMQPWVFWEVVQVLKPSALLLAKRYFEDLSILHRGPEMEDERQRFLAYLAMSIKAPFDLKSWIRYSLTQYAEERKRQVPVLIQEWKRKLESSTKPRKSSLLLTLMAIEVDLLKQRQENAEEANFKTIQTQVEELTQQFNQTSQAHYQQLLLEMMEGGGVPEESFTLAQILEAKQALDEEMALLQQQEPPVDDYMRHLTWTRQKLSIQTQQQVLALKEPLRLRILREQAQALKEEQQTLQQEAQAIEESLGQLQDSPPSPALKTNRFQQQAQLLARLDDLNRQWKAILSIPDAQERQAQIPKIHPIWQALWQDIQAEAELALQDKERYGDWLEQLDLALGEMPFSPQRQAFRSNLQLERQDLPQSTKILSEELPNLEQLAEQEEAVVKLLRESDQLLRGWLRMPLPQLWTQTQAWLEAYEDYRPQLQAKAPQQARMAALLQSLSQAAQALLPSVLRRQRSYATQILRGIEDAWVQLRQELQQAQTEQAVLALAHTAEQRAKQHQASLQNLAEMIQQDPDLQTQVQEAMDNLQPAQAQFQAAVREQQALTLSQKLETLQAELAQQNQSLQTVEQEIKQMLQKAAAQVVEEEEEEEPKAETPTPSTKTPKKREPLLVVKPVVEPLYIRNAGMVILWPYYNRLFAMLKYIEKNAFVSEEAQFKAAHILQYVVAKRTETPENEMVLNKILCGIPLEMPIPLSMEFSEDELNIAESLLQGAVNNWARMKTMAPDALRGTFLNREGSILEEADRWKLKVEKGTFDMLLKTITWGFSLIKFPWMSKPLYVEWNY